MPCADSAAVGCVLKGRNFEIAGHARLYEVVDLRDLRGSRKGTFWAEKAPVTVLPPGTQAELVLEDGRRARVVVAGFHGEELADEGGWSLLVADFISEANYRPPQPSDAD